MERLTKFITVRAPTRFDFAGGPTDVDPFKSKEGGFVVNVALEIGAKVVIKERGDKKISLKSKDLGVTEEADSYSNLDLCGPLKLIKAGVKHVRPKTGLDIEATVDTPIGSGLGSSAALSVALIYALRAKENYPEPTPQKIVDDALYLENTMLKNINGGQDQYASTLGGFHSFIFDKNSVTAHQLEISNETLESLQERSLLFYSGVSHFSGKVLDQIMERYSAGDARTVSALRQMKSLAIEIADTFVSGNLENYGLLIKKVGDVQNSFHEDVTPQSVSDIYKYAFKNGAIGAKMAGAGGGGYVYFFCEPNKSISLKTKLLQMGLMNLPFKISFKGVGRVTNNEAIPE